MPKPAVSIDIHARDKTRRGFESAQTRIKGIEQAAQRAANVIRGGFGFAAAATVIAGAVNRLRDTARFLNTLALRAEELGVSAGELRNFGRALEIVTGVSFDQSIDALTDFQEKVGEALADPNSEVGRGLDNILRLRGGISALRNADGDVLPLQDAFALVVEELAKMEPEIARFESRRLGDTFADVAIGASRVPDRLADVRGELEKLRGPTDEAGRALRDAADDVEVFLESWARYGERVTANLVELARFAAAGFGTGIGPIGPAREAQELENARQEYERLQATLSALEEEAKGFTTETEKSTVALNELGQSDVAAKIATLTRRFPQLAQAAGDAGEAVADATRNVVDAERQWYSTNIAVTEAIQNYNTLAKNLEAVNAQLADSVNLSEGEREALERTRTTLEGQLGLRQSLTEQVSAAVTAQISAPRIAKEYNAELQKQLDLLELGADETERLFEALRMGLPGEAAAKAEEASLKRSLDALRTERERLEVQQAYNAHGERAAIVLDYQQRLRADITKEEREQLLINRDLELSMQDQLDTMERQRVVAQGIFGLFQAYEDSLEGYVRLAGQFLSLWHRYLSVGQGGGSQGGILDALGNLFVPSMRQPPGGTNGGAAAIVRHYHFNWQGADLAANFAQNIDGQAPELKEAVLEAMESGG